MSCKMLMAMYRLLDVQECNVDDSPQGKMHLRDSIERAVYKASPLPSIS